MDEYVFQAYLMRRNLFMYREELCREDFCLSVSCGEVEVQGEKSVGMESTTGVLCGIHRGAIKLEVSRHDDGH